jgi:glycosyltransferase involved in cell wall biosynthesis
VLVFVQNRLHFGFTSLAEFPFRVATRLFVERLICRLFRFRVDEYIVQTPSMSRDLIAWYGKDLRKELVSVIPFNEDISSLKCNQEKKWDLIYVSDGAAHKNHINLILALVLLSEQGIFPKLAITLGDRDARLVSQISELVNRNNLRLVNLGHMSHEETLESIRSAGALIFPSKIESFGLPLIESSQLGIPILAPELDYVRDVCVPTQSFDPNSPVSISRAIKRFMCVPDYPVPIKSAKEFIQHVTS